MTKLYFKNIDCVIEGVGPAITEIPNLRAAQVMFRKYKNGDVVAMLPFEPADDDGELCKCFMLDGKTIGVCSRNVIKSTTPATYEESLELRYKLSAPPHNIILIEIWRVNHETARRVRINKLKG